MGYGPYPWAYQNKTTTSAPIALQSEATYLNHKKITQFEDVGYFLNPYVVSGGVVTKNLRRNDKIDISKCVAVLNDDVDVRESVEGIKLGNPNSTYFVDFYQGDFWVNTTHPPGTVGVDYLTLATVTTDVIGNVGTITDTAKPRGGFRLKSEYGLFNYMRPVVVVTDYGAVGDGVKDDSASLISAFEAAATGGTIYFPPGTYYLDIPIDVEISNVLITGVGATIDCRGTKDVPNVNGVGGGITINGNNNVITGLFFIGYATTQGSTDYGFGDLLDVFGDNNKIVECSFEGGNSGAVYFNGNYNVLTESYFNTCNNHAAEGADFGSVNIVGGTGNIISNCAIIGQYYAGIAMIGDVTKTKIYGNFIQCSSPLGIDTSMGIYAFNGACRDLEISNNTIENVTAEGLALFSYPSYPSDTIRVTDNTIRNYVSTAIAIYKGPDNTPSKNVKIDGNVIQAKNTAPILHIFTETLVNSIICDNLIEGFGDGVGTIGEGISLVESPMFNQVVGNSVFNVNIGINFADTAGGVCSSNMIALCSYGINYAFCQRSIIANNNIVNCANALAKGPFSEFAFLTGNMVSGYTNATSAPLLYGDVQTTTGATRPYATGVLVGGTATITFFNIDDGDVFVVAPTNYVDPANSGALYIANQEYSNSLMTIKSTNPADTRGFIVIKIASGVV